MHIPLLPLVLSLCFFLHLQHLSLSLNGLVMHIFPQLMDIMSSFDLILPSFSLPATSGFVAFFNVAIFSKYIWGGIMRWNCFGRVWRSCMSYGCLSRCWRIQDLSLTSKGAGMLIDEFSSFFIWFELRSPFVWAFKTPNCWETFFNQSLWSVKKMHTWEVCKFKRMQRC